MHTQSWQTTAHRGRRALLLLWLGLTLATSCWAQPSEVRIGVLAFRGVDMAREMWTPTAHYLSRQLPDYAFQIVPLDLRKAIEKRKYHQVVIGIRMVPNPNEECAESCNRICHLGREPTA